MLGWGLSAFPDHPTNFFDGANDTCVNEGFNTTGYNGPDGYQNPEFAELVSQFKGAKSVSEAQSLSKQMEALLFEDMPYLVLVTTPILEVYKDNISFPFTNMLDGLQQLSGNPSNVSVSD
jgi:ABC-type transport system substrate-binding protein